MLVELKASVRTFCGGAVGTVPGGRGRQPSEWQRHRREERKKRLSCCSRFTGNYSIENRVGDECLQKLIEALQRKNWAISLFTAEFFKA